MAAADLTPGCIPKIYESEKLHEKPVVQITSLRNLPTTDPNAPKKTKCAMLTAAARACAPARCAPAPQCGVVVA